MEYKTGDRRNKIREIIDALERLPYWKVDIVLIFVRGLLGR